MSGARAPTPVRHTRGRCAKAWRSHCSLAALLGHEHAFVYRCCRGNGEHLIGRDRLHNLRRHCVEGPPWSLRPGKNRAFPPLWARGAQKRAAPQSHLRLDCLDLSQRSCLRRQVLCSSVAPGTPLGYSAPRLKRMSTDQRRHSTFAIALLCQRRGPVRSARLSPRAPLCHNDAHLENRAARLQGMSASQGLCRRSNGSGGLA